MNNKSAKYTGSKYTKIMRAANLSNPSDFHGHVNKKATISKLSKFAGLRSIYKNQLYVYILAMYNWKLQLKNDTIYNSMQI